MNRLQYLLGKLAEEASELAQIALKTQQFGVYEQCPGLDENNIERVNAEFNDLMGVIKMLNDELCYSHIIQHAGKTRQKAEKVEKYYQYSKELGQVVEEE